jgi:Flp pilus assembly pilin Flp
MGHYDCDVSTRPIPAYSLTMQSTFGNNVLRICRSARTGDTMSVLFGKLWKEDEGQDIAEYAVMLAVILVIVVGTVRLVGSNANNVFSNVASSMQ